MSTAPDLRLDHQPYSAWLRAGLVLLLLLAFCCTTPAPQHLVAARPAPRGLLPVGLDEGSPDEQLALRLNLPAFRLDVLLDGRVVRSYPVAVGATRYATPRGGFEITRVVWNPWWYPPKSAWARKEKITPPGPKNPMGKVKLQMRGPYFLHGTPWPLSIGSAASHGCIRMLNEDAIALARLVQSAGGAAIDSATTDSLAGPLYDTRELDLRRPVPFIIVYDLAEVRADTLYVYPDVYRVGHGAPRAHVLAALARAEYVTAAVDQAILRRVLARATRRPQAVWVDSLFTLPTEPDMPRIP